MPEGPINDPFGLLRVPYVHFGYTIAQVRKAFGLTQGDFGALIEGFSQPNIARYESGDTDPPVDFWRKFSRITSLNLVWVFTGEGEPYLPTYKNEQARVRARQFVRGFVASNRRTKAGEAAAAAYFANRQLRDFLGDTRPLEDDDEPLAIDYLLDDELDAPAAEDVAEEVDETISRVERVAKKQGSTRSKRRSKGG